MKPGVDSAAEPTEEQVIAAEADGIVWWGCYVGGQGAFHVWSDEAIELVAAHGIIPVPIWVPTMQLSESAADAASQAISRCDRLGLTGLIVLDTEIQMEATDRLRPFVDVFCATVGGKHRPAVVYDGAGYIPTGAVAWRPLWGSSEVPAAGEAIQYGPTQRWGMAVDVDEADDGFPFEGASPVPATPLEDDMANLVIYHDTASLVWRLVNTATNTLVSNLTGNPAAVASFEAAGGKVLAWNGAGAEFN